jgi:hypothetical protein
MPTNRRYRRAARIPEVSELEWLFLIEEHEAAKKINFFTHLMLQNYDHEARELWEAQREPVFRLLDRSLSGNETRSVVAIRRAAATYRTFLWLLLRRAIAGTARTSQRNWMSSIRTPGNGA